MGMEFSFMHHADLTVIFIGGEVNISSLGAFKDKVIPIAESTNGHLQIDCKELEYIDSRGFSVLEFTCSIVRRKGFEVTLMNVSWNIQKLLAITELDKLFNIAA